MNYDPTTTKVYDIRKLDFGDLQQGENSNLFEAKFPIIDVIQDLFELRKKLRDNLIADEEQTAAI